MPRILVIDDDRSVRHLIGKVLKTPMWKSRPRPPRKACNLCPNRRRTPCCSISCYPIRPAWTCLTKFARARHQAARDIYYFARQQ